MAVVKVGSSQALLKAVQFAGDGDVIKLAPGTYSNLILRDISFSKGLTITSADPNNPATLTDLIVRNSVGLTFSDLNLYNAKNIDLAFQFLSSSNLILDNLDVSGSGNTTNALSARLAIIRNSTNVQVTDSEFAYGWHGLSLLNNKQVTIQNNYFHDMRTDGVRGGGNSDLTIQANVFMSFHPKGADHPDAIQLWTSNTARSASNIIIDSNIIARGSGDPIQGIFIRDISGSLPFVNVLVTNNIVEGARYNGIAVSGVKNGYIADNIVQAFADQPSGLQVQNSTGVILRSNEASKFFGGLQPIVGQSGNSLIAVATDQGVATINHWLSQNPEFTNGWKSIDPTVLSVLQWDGSIPTGGNSSSNLTADSFVPIVPPASQSPASADDDVPQPVPSHASPAPVDQNTSPNGAIIVDGNHAVATGGPGNDVYYVSGPNDAINEAPGGGIDTVFSSGDYVLGDNVENLKLTGNGAIGEGNDLANRISGSNGNDLLRGWGSADVINGRDGNDVIMGDNGNDSLHGDDGNDKLYGGAGRDNIQGDTGNDTIDGGGGRDTIDGGPGSDIMTGGAGNDIFRFRIADAHKQDVDIITDFQPGVDSIMITAGLFDVDPAAEPSFSFIGKSAFHDKAGEVRFFDGPNGVTVQTDINGDGVSDFEFSLRGVHSLSARDFIL